MSSVFRGLTLTNAKVTKTIYWNIVQLGLVYVIIIEE